MADVLEPRVSRTEYLVRERAAEYKSEWWDGEIVAMTGASREHNLVQGNLCVLLVPPVRARGCETYPGDMRVRPVKTDRYLYPDVVIACGPKFEDGEFDTLTNPLLLFEILSPSTESHDRLKKAAAYQGIPSLAEYVYLAQSRMRAEHFRRQADGRWTGTVLDGPDEVIVLASIGCEVRLGDVYAGVPISAGPERA